MCKHYLPFFHVHEMVTHSGRVSSAALAATEALRVKQAEFIGKKLIKSKKYCLISDSRLN